MMPDDIDWTLTTWEGNRRRQHEEFRALPLRTKLAMIEQMSEVSERFARQRAERQSAANSVPTVESNDRG
jgi:hypothetical protein